MRPAPTRLEPRTRVCTHSLLGGPGLRPLTWDWALEDRSPLPHETAAQTRLSGWRAKATPCTPLTSQPVGALGPMLGTDASWSAKPQTLTASGPAGQGTRAASPPREGPGPGSQGPRMSFQPPSPSHVRTHVHVDAEPSTRGHTQLLGGSGPARALGPLGGRAGLRPRRPPCWWGPGQGV